MPLKTDIKLDKKIQNTTKKQITCTTYIQQEDNTRHLVLIFVQCHLFSKQAIEFSQCGVMSTARSFFRGIQPLKNHM